MSITFGDLLGNFMDIILGSAASGAGDKAGPSGLIVGFSRSGRFVGRLGRPKQEFPWKGKIRTALPIVAGGNTAAIHVFCDSED